MILTWPTWPWRDSYMTLTQIAEHLLLFVCLFIWGSTYMCLDGLRKEAMSIPFNVLASRGWKSEAGINSFYLDTLRNWVCYPAPLACHYKNFIWEQKIYHCTVIPWIVRILGDTTFRTIQNQHYSRLLLSSKRDPLLFKEPFLGYLHLITH